MHGTSTNNFENIFPLRFGMWLSHWPTEDWNSSPQTFRVNRNVKKCSILSFLDEMPSPNLNQAELVDTLKNWRERANNKNALHISLVIFYLILFWIGSLSLTQQCHHIILITFVKLQSASRFFSLLWQHNPLQKNSLQLSSLLCLIAKSAMFCRMIW